MHDLSHYSFYLGFSPDLGLNRVHSQLISNRKDSVHVVRKLQCFVRGSVLFRRRCITLSTSGFADDVTFHTIDCIARHVYS